MGQRASRGLAGVWGPRDTGARRAQRHAGVDWARSSPLTDLDNPSGARIGRGWGRRLWSATCQGAGPDPSTRGRRGTGGDATSRDEGAVWRSGVPRLEGARPLSSGQHTPGGPPKYPDPGQQGNHLSESQGDRIWSGGGVSPSWFSQPPYYLFEPFALEGFLCLAHLGWLLWPLALRLGRGILTLGRPSPSPFDKTNCALDYDTPMGFAVILSSRWEKARLLVDSPGSSFDEPS